MSGGKGERRRRGCGRIAFRGLMNGRATERNNEQCPGLICIFGGAARFMAPSAALITRLFAADSRNVDFAISAVGEGGFSRSRVCFRLVRSFVHRYSLIF